RLEGYGGRPGFEPAAKGLLDLPEADSAHFALGLCEDHLGLKAAKCLPVDAVDRKRFLEDGLHAPVYLVTCPIGAEFGFGADRQPFDGLGKVALVRTADKKGLATEGADDLGAARNQRHYPLDYHSLPRHFLPSLEFSLQAALVPGRLKPELRTQLAEIERVPEHNFACREPDLLAEYRTGIDEGVELPVFAARIHARRKGAQELLIDHFACEGGRENARIDADHDRPETQRDKVLCHLSGVPLPDGIDPAHPDSAQDVLPVRADVFEEEVAENRPPHPPVLIPAQSLQQLRLVFFVGGVL